MDGTFTSVQVAVRIRPIDSTQCKIVLKKELNQVKIKDTSKTVAYDYVFDPNCHQDEVYEKCMKSKIEHLFAGYDFTVLTYGATGTGKTHTLGTVYNGEDEMGLIPRAVIEIFNCVRDNFIYDFSITVSFMELYEETLRDLLSDEKRVLRLEDGEDEEILIPGLTEIPVFNKKEVFDQLIRASLNRATEQKCHAIFIINLTMVNKKDGTEKRAKFKLVDLAGRTPLKTWKPLEDATTNLFSLNNVISTLSGDKQPQGGTSITLMIACVNPAEHDLEATICTLRYAAETRKIRNKPVMNLNQAPKMMENNLLKKAVEELKRQNIGQGGSLVDIVRLREENVRLQSKIQDFHCQLSSIMNDNIKLKAKVVELQNVTEALNNQIQGYTRFNQNVSLIHNRDLAGGVKTGIRRRSLQIQDLQQIWRSDKGAVGKKIQIEEMDAVVTSQANKAVDQITTDTKIQSEKMDVVHTSQDDEAIAQMATDAKIQIEKMDVLDTSQAVAQISTPVKNRRRRAMCFNDITSASTENTPEASPVEHVKESVKSSNNENVDVSTEKPFLDTTGVKKTGGGCGCSKSKCATRVCGCKKQGRKCSSRCSCVCCKNVDVV